MNNEQKEAWGNFAEALKNFDEKQKEQLVDDFLMELARKCWGDYYNGRTERLKDRWYQGGIEK